MSVSIHPALLPADGDCHAVAITKLAMASLVLGRATISPKKISRHASELDSPDSNPRGVSTFTLRNNPACKALLDEFRTHRAAPARRRAQRVPAHIRDMSKTKLIDALGRARAEGARKQCALDQIAPGMAKHDRKIDRTKLEPSLILRATLAASRVAGNPPAALLERAAGDAARSVRLIKAALKHLGKDARPTRSEVLRAARLVDPEGRGLHDDIFEDNKECAALVAKANGRAEGPRAPVLDKALARLDNYQLGLAVWVERQHVKILTPILAKATDIIIDLELPALLETMRSEDRRYRVQEAELAHALAEVGIE